MAETPIPEGDFLLYDGDCPVCRTYVGWTALRQSHPDIQLIDARERPDLVAALRAEGIEINDTNLLQLDGQRFTGAAAMALVSRKMRADGIGRKVLKAATAPERVLRPIYPWFVRGRKALLWLAGRDQIR